jgi:ATP-binding cassette subfamily A (ABC1) protein 3
VLALSFIFPSANYTYFINSLALWEAAGRKVSVTEDVPDHKSFGGGEIYRPRIYVYFLFLAVQIVVFPILAFAVEHILFSTASAGRRFTPATDARGPTVTLSGFGKT